MHLKSNEFLQTFLFGLIYRLLCLKPCGYYAKQTLQKRTNSEILKTEYVGGLIPSSAASFITGGLYVEWAFAFIFFFQCFSYVVKGKFCLAPDQSIRNIK